MNHKTKFTILGVLAGLGIIFRGIYFLLEHGNLTSFIWKPLFEGLLSGFGVGLGVIFVKLNIEPTSIMSCFIPYMVGGLGVSLGKVFHWGVLQYRSRIWHPIIIKK